MKRALRKLEYESELDKTYATRSLKYLKKKEKPKGLEAIIKTGMYHLKAHVVINCKDFPNRMTWGGRIFI